MFDVDVAASEQVFSQRRRKEKKGQDDVHRERKSRRFFKMPDALWYVGDILVC